MVAEPSEIFLVRRRADKGQADGDVHAATKRRSLERSHADIVVGGDHGIEFAGKRAQEHGVGRHGTDRSARVAGEGVHCWLIHVPFFGSKHAVVRGVRV